MSLPRDLEYEANSQPSPVTDLLTTQLAMASVCPGLQLKPGQTEELPSAGICYGTSGKKEAMEGENLDLHLGHAALGQLFNRSMSILAPVKQGQQPLRC